MADTSVEKLDSIYAPSNPMGRKHLASGKHIAMRLWDAMPGNVTQASRREYETVGFIIGGRAELHIEGQVIQLCSGDSWVVPKGAEHFYRILEHFQAIEATAPPVQIQTPEE